MKIKINENQTETKIPVMIQNNWQHIEDIKNELRNCVASPALCKIQVFDMWDKE